MKNANQIIKNIQNKPQFSKLSRYKCIDRIKSIFTPPLQRMIKFSYMKNNTLFFVLNHPGAKQEFDNNIQSIKSALNFYTPEECTDVLIEDIKAFVTHTPNKVFVLKPKEPVLYSERSTGNFEINIKDEKLNQLVRNIRNIIKEKINHDA